MNFQRPHKSETLQKFTQLQMSGHCNEAWFTEIRSELCLLNRQLDMNQCAYYNWPWHISLESQLQVLQCFRASATVKTKVPRLFCFTLGLGDPYSPVFPTYWPIRTNHSAHIFVFLFSSNSKLWNVPVPLAPYLSTHMVSPRTVSNMEHVYLCGQL